MFIKVKFKNPICSSVCDTENLILVFELQNNHLVPNKMVCFKNGKIINEDLCVFGNL